MSLLFGVIHHKWQAAKYVCIWVNMCVYVQRERLGLQCISRICTVVLRLELEICPELNIEEMRDKQG